MSIQEKVNHGLLNQINTIAVFSDEEIITLTLNTTFSETLVIGKNYHLNRIKLSYQYHKI